MPINFKSVKLDLTNKHKSTCMFKDSSHIEKRNVLRTKIDNEFVDVNYDVYCTCCNEYLWNYHWGTIKEDKND